MLGREVARLVDGDRRAGYHVFVWDGKNRRGNLVSSGIYIYRMIATSVEMGEQYVMTRKMLLLKVGQP